MVLLCLHAPLDVPVLSKAHARACGQSTLQTRTTCIVLPQSRLNIFELLALPHVDTSRQKHEATHETRSETKCLGCISVHVHVEKLGCGGEAQRSWLLNANWHLEQSLARVGVQGFRIAACCTRESWNRCRKGLLSVAACTTGRFEDSWTPHLLSRSEVCPATPVANPRLQAVLKQRLLGQGWEMVRDGACMQSGWSWWHACVSRFAAWDVVKGGAEKRGIVVHRAPRFVVPADKAHSQGSER